MVVDYYKVPFSETDWVKQYKIIITSSPRPEKYQKPLDRKKVMEKTQLWYPLLCWSAAKVDEIKIRCTETITYNRVSLTIINPKQQHSRACSSVYSMYLTHNTCITRSTIKTCSTTFNTHYSIYHPFVPLPTFGRTKTVLHYT